MFKRRVCLALILCLIWAGTGARAECAVVLEDHDILRFERQLFSVPRGGALEAVVYVPEGWRVTGANIENWTVSPQSGESVNGYIKYMLRVTEIEYPVLIRLEAKRAGVLRYHLPDGNEITVTDTSGRARVNTLKWSAEYDREGYTLTGWRAEGGEEIGLGSRADVTEDGTELTGVYMEWTAEGCFDFEESPDGLILTECRAEGTIVIPGAVGGQKVTGIAKGAFGDLQAEMLVLPPTMKKIEAGAFDSLDVAQLVFFDNLSGLDGMCGGTCRIGRLCVNAAREPVWGGSYWAAFPEKMDYLMSLKGRKKLILLGGSGVRFDYDCAKLEEALEGIFAANMGVYAYGNMRPQAEMILGLAEAGDILLSSPEMDAIDMQFCASCELDVSIFRMTEENYDLLKMLDWSGYTGIFAAWDEYQAGREKMEETGYDLLPSQFDEDGKYTASPSYDRWGDYILYRENNVNGGCFGVKRATMAPRYVTEADIAGLNRVYDAFAAKGVAVLYAWSPRNRESLTEDSTEENRTALESMLAEKLHAEMITHVEDALIDPLYFYGTDNHLSTEGAARHTEKMAAAVKEALE